MIKIALIPIVKTFSCQQRHTFVFVTKVYVND